MEYKIILLTICTLSIFFIVFSVEQYFIMRKMHREQKEKLNQFLKNKINKIKH